MAVEEILAWAFIGYCALFVVGGLLYWLYEAVVYGDSHSMEIARSIPTGVFYFVGLFVLGAAIGALFA